MNKTCLIRSPKRLHHVTIHPVVNYIQQTLWYFLWMPLNVWAHTHIYTKKANKIMFYSCEYGGFYSNCTGINKKTWITNRLLARYWCSMTTPVLPTYTRWEQLTTIPQEMQTTGKMEVANNLNESKYWDGKAGKRKQCLPRLYVVYLC